MVDVDFVVVGWGYFVFECVDVVGVEEYCFFVVCIFLFDLFFEVCGLVFWIV